MSLRLVWDTQIETFSHECWGEGGYVVPVL